MHHGRKRLRFCLSSNSPEVSDSRYALDVISSLSFPFSLSLLCSSALSVSFSASDQAGATEREKEKEGTEGKWKNAKKDIWIIPRREKDRERERKRKMRKIYLYIQAICLSDSGSPNAKGNKTDLCGITVCLCACTKQILFW